ncbi:MAG: glycosyltransferase family protein, partial [Planctomycetia bacterium]|nr:glycosyltransferase family protein [Planctomycetia bacterium]
RLGEFEHAAEHYRNATQLAPNDARAHQNLGSALAMLGCFSESIEHYRRAIALMPGRADLYRGLGAALSKVQAYDEAEQTLSEALSLEPNNPVTHTTLGTTLLLAGRIEDAIAQFNRALQLNPSDPEPQMRRAMCLLMQADYQEGWLDYEARKNLGYLRYRHIEPRWEGEPLAGRTLLVETEQGLGDSIQFVRYLPAIKTRHIGRVILACEPPLLPLLTDVGGADVLVPQDRPRPPFDCWIPLMSLPRVFGPAPLPALAPYLSADSSRVAHWRSRLASIPGRKIGIAWQGSPSYPGDRDRSIPLSHFLQLQNIPGVSLISLQKGFGTEQLAENPGHRVLALDDELDADGAFLDTAAVMRNLDLVISSDTSIPHLAGALGVPVWLALPLVPHWRWQLHGETTPWYPSMRLFRQIKRGDWGQVFERIAAELT